MIRCASSASFGTGADRNAALNIWNVTPAEAMLTPCNSRSSPAPRLPAITRNDSRRLSATFWNVTESQYAPVLPAILEGWNAPNCGRRCRWTNGGDAYRTLHMWTQIVGKIRMTLTPPLNHWWHVPLYVSPSGLTTGPILTPAGFLKSASISSGTS